MNGAARSVVAFGVYLLGTGAMLVFAHNTLLGLLGIAPATEPWICVLGIIVAVLGVYYVVCGRANSLPFIRATVPVRLSILLAFGALVVISHAPPQLIGFAVVDAVGALWTWSQLRAQSS